MRIKQIIVGTMILILAGCAGLAPVKNDAKTEFTFDYKDLSKPKDELWKAARDFFAEAYGDSRSVFRVMDKDDGTIIGKGIASWNLMGNRCSTNYHIRFAAKDNKARLQFEIMRGVPPLSKCQGWPWPSKDGYQEIVDGFKLTSIGLKKALSGDGDTNKLKDF